MFICAALVLGVAHGKRFYKYQDDEGVWHFTDRPPDGDQAVESELIRVDEQDFVSVRRLDGHDFPTYQFTNTLAGPVSVSLKFARSDNVQANPSLPAVLVLEPYESKTLLRVSPVDDQRGWEYQLSYRYSPGANIESYDRTHVYGAPFSGTDDAPISQAFNGKFSHQNPQAKHAVDITLPEGTPIVAARDGVVMQVEDDFFGRGLDMEEFATRANSVRILHDDGTMGVYAHLKVESAVVSVGQAVKAGAKLALSGDTGFTTGPHLHFVIQRSVDGALESVPFRFADQNGRPLLPERGMMLRAAPARRAP